MVVTHETTPSDNVKSISLFFCRVCFASTISAVRFRANGVVVSFSPKISRYHKIDPFYSLKSKTFTKQKVSTVVNFIVHFAI